MNWALACPDSFDHFAQEHDALHRRGGSFGITDTEVGFGVEVVGIDREDLSIRLDRLLHHHGLERGIARELEGIEVAVGCVDPGVLTRRRFGYPAEISRRDGRKSEPVPGPSQLAQHRGILRSLLQFVFQLVDRVQFLPLHLRLRVGQEAFESVGGLTALRLDRRFLFGSLAWKKIQDSGQCDGTRYQDQLCTAALIGINRSLRRFGSS